VVALLTVLVVVLAALVLLAALGRASAEPWSDEDYRRRARAGGSGVLAASMRVLGEQLDSGARGAAEHRESERRGTDEAPDPGGEGPSPPE
jgi:hypothetical protein